MGLILTATAGLCIWIVLWAINLFSGFDSILIGIVMVLIAIADPQPAAVPARPAGLAPRRTHACSHAAGR